MKEYLVGYTGFVGSNIAAKHEFSGLFNSKNVQEAYGENPDLLVYSGVKAEMFLANRNPEADFAMMEEALGNIRNIAPKKLVLISTIAVYHNPDNVDEEAAIEESNLAAYGKNRMYLEKKVRESFPDALIVRLPGLYGANLKKNFIYDFIKIIPAMLTEEKYRNLSGNSQLIQDSYYNLENGFYKYKGLEKEEEQKLKEEFEKAGFSALNFTDSRGTYQYYNLENLWNDIKIALKHDIKLLNLAVEPVTAGELFFFLTGQEFVNCMDKPVPYFNYRTKHAEYFGGADGYIKTKEAVLEDIKKYVSKMRGIL
ncbi:MAG: sugar nucleotide-binding protein [Lachnospiraceae bacterium]|nr:sugar nucleotide-binding protein [Lachnospiraceae bacterium]